MNKKDIYMHEHKINPKYGNIKSYISRCKKLLNGNLEITDITPIECLNIIENTLISLQEEHEKFIKQIK